MDLKPCPFCGGAAMTEYTADKHVYIHCPTCFKAMASVSTRRYSVAHYGLDRARAMARRDWNTRRRKQ